MQPNTVIEDEDDYDYIPPTQRGLSRMVTAAPVKPFKGRQISGPLRAYGRVSTDCRNYEFPSYYKNFWQPYKSKQLKVDKNIAYTSNIYDNEYVIAEAMKNDILQRRKKFGDLDPSIEEEAKLASRKRIEAVTDLQALQEDAERKKAYEARKLREDINDFKLEYEKRVNMGTYSREALEEYKTSQEAIFQSRYNKLTTPIPVAPEENKELISALDRYSSIGETRLGNINSGVNNMINQFGRMYANNLIEQYAGIRPPSTNAQQALPAPPTQQTAQQTVPIVHDITPEPVKLPDWATRSQEEDMKLLLNATGKDTKTLEEWYKEGIRVYDTATNELACKICYIAYKGSKPYTCKQPNSHIGHSSGNHQSAKNPKNPTAST